MTPDHPDANASISPPAVEPTAPATEAVPAAVLSPGPSPLVERATHRQALLAAAAGAVALGIAYVAAARSPQRVAEIPVKAAPKPAMVLQPVAARAGERLASEDREALVEGVVRSQMKRIMGRKRSLPDIARIVTQISPLITRALAQPSIQTHLRELAAQEGMSLPEYKRYFQRIQEADLLLESGGDPNARSPSDAIGVAQFLAGTARASGNLKVNVPESRRLTWRIGGMQSQIAALQSLPEAWAKPLPGSATPALRIASASGSLPGTRNRPDGGSPPGRASLSSRGSSARRRAPAEATAAPAADPAGTADEAAKTEAASATEASSVQPGAAATASDAGSPSSPAGPSNDPAAADPAAAADEPPAAAPEPPAAPTPEAKPATPAPRVITRDELIQKRVAELRLLEAKRRQVDERYDPAKAIAAQTRYLVRMARRYGSLDWTFQAYHGGEGGVRNTVSYYLGSRWQQFASAESAIRGVLASRGGGYQRVRAPLSFEELYFRTAPLSHPMAFSYLYGRSDNHRYYWWKILAAERAIDIYRRDPQEFHTQWRALRPGQRLEVVWYPNSKELNFRDAADLKRGYAAGELVRWPASARSRGLVLGDVAPLDPANGFDYKGLRPEALGALYRIAAIYLANGGSKQPLTLHSLVQPEAYRARLNATRPPSWMRRLTKPEDVPIDLQPTGLCFDIVRPTTEWNRKVLEYALGVLADRNQIAWVEEREQGPRRYHVTPAPKFRQELARSVRPADGKRKRA
jgi:hypothetical protein